MGAAVAGPAASLVGAGLGVAGDLAQGQASKLKGQIDSIRLHEQAEAAKVRGVQTSATYQENFADGLSAFQAIRAGQGAGVDSATSMALIDKAEDRNEMARKTAVSNQALAAITSNGDAAAALTAGRNAMTASYLKAGVDATKGAGALFSLGSSLGG